MILDETSVNQILKWLSAELAPICEADPNVLAKYVVALLKHDKGKELKSHCIDQLRDFLKGETEPFVDLLFNALEDGSYARATSLEDDDIDRKRRDDENNDDDDDNYRRWPRNRDGSDDEAQVHGDDVNNDDDYHRRYRADRHEENDSFKKRRFNESDEPDSYRNGIDRRLLDESTVTSLDESKGSDRNNNRIDQIGNRFDRFDRRKPGQGFQGGPPGRVWANNGAGQYGNSGRRWEDRRGPVDQRLFPQQRFGGGRIGPNFGGIGVGNEMMMYGGMPAMYSMGLGMTTHGPLGPPGMLPGYRMDMGAGGVGLAGGLGMANMIGALLPRTMGAMALMDKRTADSQVGNPSADSGSRGAENGSASRPPAPPLPEGQPPTGPPTPLGSSMAPYPQIPLISQHTLRCTGIPSHITEQELRAHFSTFGRVVELRVLSTPMPMGYPTGGAAKSYCECLVQFADPADAKRCFGSPLPVLNNRFIKLFFNRTNIVPPGFTTSDDNVAGTTAPSAISEANMGRAHQSAVSQDQKREQAHRGRAERAEAGQAVLQQYDTIRSLRQEAETLFKKRERLLVDEIDQYKAMLSKLSSLGASTSSAKMVETIESKLMELQSQLQLLREQHERGEAAEAIAPEPAGRGRGRGRGARAGRFGGRGGRGRGRAVGRVGNQSIDNRPRALLIQNPPKDFIHSAESHFIRFGSVSKCEARHDDVVVEFGTRKSAEVAKTQGSSYAGQLLTIVWHENEPAITATATGDDKDNAVAAGIGENGDNGN